jgi:hypothetical protein
MDELSTIYDEVTGIDLSLEEAESCDDCWETQEKGR